MNQVDAVRSRLKPELNKPFFEIESRHMGAVNRCDHVGRGQRLDATDRRVYCKGCGIMLDPFEALLIYARSERRLLNAAETIREHEKRERERKERERTRRPFKRDVLGTAPMIVSNEGIETVEGHVLTLSCRHTLQWPGGRVPRSATCRTCEREGRR